jgi:hypothetical protein
MAKSSKMTIFDHFGSKSHGQDLINEKAFLKMTKNPFWLSFA